MLIDITPQIKLNENELEFHFTQAGGPGGQHVNKVATAVQLRFDVYASTAFPEDVRNRLIKLAGKRLTTDGILVIDARRFRSQEKNRRDAVDRLVDLIRSAATVPKKRQRTRTPRKAKRIRFENKLHRSRLKQKRRSVSDTGE
jgi:ribosome-associated protein